jgi:hypothetical protein
MALMILTRAEQLERRMRYRCLGWNAIIDNLEKLKKTKTEASVKIVHTQLVSRIPGNT